MMDDDQQFEDFLNDTYQENVELAQAALDRGDDQLALELAEECLEEKQFDVEVLNICAVAATNLDDLVKAQGLFVKALQLNPRNGALHHNYAVLLDRQRNFEAAVTHLEKALELQPDFPEAYINLGNVLDELDRTPEALHCYREALHRMPDSHDAFYNIGYACNRLGRYEEALSNFLKALDLYRDDAGSLNGAGFALANLQRLDDAGAYYDRALEIDPRNATYLFNRGLLQTRLGQHSRARGDFERALKLDPEFFEALIELLAVLVELRCYDEAAEYLERAELLDPESPEPPFYRALLAERKGDAPQALAQLEICLQRDPSSLQVLNNKGNILLGMRRYDEAMACFDQVLIQDPDYALAHFNRACVLAQCGKPDDSVAALARALKLDGSLADEVSSDPDFVPLHSDVRFHELVKLAKGE